MTAIDMTPENALTSPPQRHRDSVTRERFTDEIQIAGRFEQAAWLSGTMAINGEIYDESTDVRFAIDDEDDDGAATQHESVPLAARGVAINDETITIPDTASSLSGQQTTRYQSVPQTEGEDDDNASHKYPPAVPPPSYREATGASLLSGLYEQMSGPVFSFAQQASRLIWSIVCRFWPTSRFAQLGLFMAGLWLLVIVSGPAFEEAGPHAGAGYPWAGLDKLASGGPKPISGDGHIKSAANWTLDGCHKSKAHRGEVLCTSTTRIELKAPKSFASNEDVFILVDPLRRDHLSDGRGHVPGTLEVKLVEEGTAPEQSPKGVLSVLIEAKYEQSRIEIFEQTTVAKMAARFNSEGVGIYSYPLPAKYRDLSPPPLYMHITVLVPAGTVVPALRVDASSMSIGAFTTPEPMKVPHEARSISGEPRASAPVRKLAAPFFGRFMMTSAAGSVHAGNTVPLAAVGMVKLRSINDDVVVASEIQATELRLESTTGSIRIEEGAIVTAFREAHLSTQTGNIELRPKSVLKSSVTTATTQNGGILGGDVDASVPPGVWATNHTLEMRSSNGIVRAAVAVHNVTIPAWNAQNRVRVGIESKNGDVNVRFLEQQTGPVLQAHITSGLGAVTAQMAPAFAGDWSLDGSRQSTVIPPPTGDRRTLKQTVQKKKPTGLHEEGFISLDKSRGNTKPDASANVNVKSSLGLAKLSFA